MRTLRFTALAVLTVCVASCAPADVCSLSQAEQITVNLLFGALLARDAERRNLRGPDPEIEARLEERRDEVTFSSTRTLRKRGGVDYCSAKVHFGESDQEGSRIWYSVELALDQDYIEVKLTDTSGKPLTKLVPVVGRTPDTALLMQLMQ